MAQTKDKPAQSEAEGVGVTRARGDDLGPVEPVKMPASMGATFAERAKSNKKAVQSAENKSVSGAEVK